MCEPGLQCHVLFRVWVNDSEGAALSNSADSALDLMLVELNQGLKPLYPLCLSQKTGSGL